MIFSKTDKQAIEAAIKAAEAKTSGEIVPVVVNASGDYGYVAHRLGVLFFALASGAILFLHHEFPFWELHYFLAFQAFAWVLGWHIGGYGWMVRAVAGKKHLDGEVHQAALAAFTYNGIHHTTGETGVLIFISLLEHRVEIIADRGIHAKLGEGYWSQQVESIVTGIASGNASPALQRVIGEIGAKLAENFPSTGEDRNELTDELRLR